MGSRNVSVARKLMGGGGNDSNNRGTKKKLWLKPGDCSAKPIGSSRGKTQSRLVKLTQWTLVQLFKKQ